jgi:ribosomal protein S18 acetylase RimI-like enzyme
MFQIRQATLADVTAVTQLNHALFQEDGGQRDPTLNLEWATEHGHDYFTKLISTGMCFVALVEEAIVGYLIGYTRDPSSYRLVKTAELESMFVQTPHRGQGIGKALAQAFIHWAAEQQAHHITVTAYATNERAIAFYQSLNFTPKNLTLALTL